MLIFDHSRRGRTAASQFPAAGGSLDDLPAALRRKNAPALPEVSELDVVRHYTRLSQKNFSIDTLFGGAPGFYGRVAEEMQLPLEQDIFNDVLKDNRLKSDPIHANAAGYRVVAERLAEFLRKAGAL